MNNLYFKLIMLFVIALLCYRVIALLCYRVIALSRYCYCVIEKSLFYQNILMSFTCPFCITINDINHIINCNCEINKLEYLNKRMNTKYIKLTECIENYVEFIKYNQTLFPYY